MAGEEIHTIYDHAEVRAAQMREGEVARQKGNGGRRELDVVEMFSFIQSMCIDPIKESEMIWIAEEALHVQLPPGWTEHVDDRGRPYFHNTNTNASSWHHPMDDVFKDLVEYYRQVQEEGGFWMVEDQLSEHEENIRRELSEWQELFDERNRKFYYNRQTEESRFDDPRHAVYHCLYARIKLVSKMRDKLPFFAAVPRPEDPSVERARRKLQRQQDQEKQVSIKMQSVWRMMKARKKAQDLRKRREMNLMPPSMQEGLILRRKLRGAGGQFQEDLLLEMPPARRRDLAVLKIQAFFRGTLARIHTRPMMRHRRRLHRKAKKIQLHWRQFLHFKWMKGERDRQCQTAAKTILQMAQSRIDRLFFQTVLDDHVRFLQYRLRCIIKVQAFFKGVAQRIIFKKRKAVVVAALVTLQSTFRMHEARRELELLYRQDQPCQFVFSPNGDEQSAGLMPWSWQLQMVPVSLTNILSKETHRVEDIFWKGGLGDASIVAAAVIQKWARGKVGRRRAWARDQELRQEAKRKAKEAAIMPFSATEIQRRWRGHSVRKRDFLNQKRQELIQKNIDDVRLILSHMAKVKEQDQLIYDLKMERATDASVVIQTYWRRHKAQQVAKRLFEETLWPIKGCFEFFATGTEAVRCQVRFHANPDFAFEHFFDEKAEEGTGYSMGELLESMEDEVEACLARYLAELALKEKERLERLGRGEDDLDTAEPSLDWFDSMFTLDEETELNGESINVVDGSAIDEAEQEMEVEMEMETDEEKPRRKRLHPEGPTVERISYAGMMVDGRYRKTNALNLEQLSETDKQSIMADLELDRHRRVEELMQKQRKHQARQLKRQRQEAQMMATSRQAFRRSRSCMGLDPRLMASSPPPPRPAVLDDMMDDPLFKRLATQERRRTMLMSSRDEATKTMRMGATARRGVGAGGGSLPSVSEGGEMSSRAGEKHMHMHMHKHHEEVLWKSGVSSPSGSPVLPSLTGAKGGFGATAMGPAFPKVSKLERAMSASEMTRPGGPGKGKVAAIRGIPLTQSNWAPGGFHLGMADSFADTVRQPSFRGQLGR